MATPLDISAAIIGTASLAMQVFQGCVAGYQLLHDAQQVGNEGDLLRLKLQIERDRLQDWGKAAGIERTQPENRLNWELIKSILEHQRGILEASEARRIYYGLEDVVEEDVVEERDPEAKKPTGVGRILATVRPDLYSRTASHIYSHNRPLKRVKWALVGAKTLNKIVTDLRDLNTGLVQLLEPHVQVSLERHLGALCRDLLSRSTTLPDVEAFARLAKFADNEETATLPSVARFRKLRLLLAWDKQEDEERPKVRPPAHELRVNKRLPTSKLELQPLQKKEGLNLARYNKIPVLVEWRRVPPGMFKVYRTYLEDLAFLLGNASESFAALSCMGHMVEPNEHLFAFVYEVPAVVQAKDSGQVAQRIEVAITIAQAVLELHTAGWLHKSIQSDKIIFVHETDLTAREAMQHRPYLVGYEAARPDERHAVAISEFTIMSLEERLYQHPSRDLGESTTRTPYRKEFDLYALGCLLVEIALWQPLVLMYKEIGKENWPAKIQEAELSGKYIQLPSLIDYVKYEEFCDAIEHAVGSEYIEAVKLCAADESSIGANACPGVDTQKEIVSRLQASRLSRPPSM